MTAVGHHEYPGPSLRGTGPSLTPLDLAKRIADLAQEKLASDVVVLDMREACSFTDYFVIATGRNTRQTQAIAEEVREQVKAETRVVPRGLSGGREGTWIVADYLDVVLHVFTAEAREFYGLEQLWGDVPAVELAAS